jgi:putative ABC transport system permease protein
MCELLADFSGDVRYALRQARKHLSLTIICAAVLAIGIGSTVAVFAILYDAILKPLPYRDAAQLVYVHNEFPRSQLAETEESAPDFADLSAHHDIFSETAAYYFNDFTMTGAGAAQHVDAVNASATLFTMLGMRPELGRVFTPEEDRYGAAKVLILSDAFWRSAFGADRSIIGRSIALDGAPYKIVGVMPADFNFPYPATQMWIPLALKPSRLAPDARGGKWLQMVARVAPGLTPERANNALVQISHGYAKAYPDDYPEKTGWHFSCVPMAEQQTQAIRGWLLLAFGAVFCVLLIACINVSVLLLVRASVRRGEWAVRAALGASPARLVRQIFVETGVLVLIGCGVGIFLALVVVDASNRFSPLHRTSIEPWTFVFCVALCILGTVIAGVLPALSFSRLQLDQELHAGSVRASGGESNWRRILVAGQIGIAIALLFSATALSRSFVKLLDVPPGFSPEHVWTGSIQLPERNSTPPQLFVQFFQNLSARISALPGVESASATNDLPFSSGGFTADLYFPGRPETAVRPAALYYIVLSGYIETMRIRLLEGRALTADDGPNSQPVAIVDRAFVQKYFPHEDPIGKMVANNGHGDFAGSRDHPATIMGVIDSVAEHDLAQPVLPAIYVPASQMPRSAMFIVARTKGNVDITSAVRDTLRSMDPTVALFDVETMSERVQDSLRLRRFVAWLLNSFAFTGVLLAMLGLYGTLAHLVELRRREIAIRMALGASPRSVRSLVARHSLYIALGGLIPGAIFSFAAIRATQSFLFGISPLDAWTVAATLLGFFALALLASWIPVMRATRINALLALREE